MSDEKESLDLDGNHQRRPSCTYEDVIKALGGFGRFQLIQVTLCALHFFLVTTTGLGFVFIGRTPDHVCNTVNESETLSRYGLLNDSTASLSYGKCEVTVRTNQSGLPVDIASFDCPDGRHFPGGKHQTLVSQWDLVCESLGQAELGQSLFIVGQIVGAIFLNPIADRFGRKWFVIINSMLCTVIVFSIAFSPNIYTVWVFLFFQGITLMGLNGSVVIVGVEYLEPKHRPTYGVGLCFFWVFFLLIIALAGYVFEDLGWRYFQAFTSVAGLILLLYPFFLYESPRWLASKNRSREALVILQKACRQNNVEFAPVKETFLEYIRTIHPESESLQRINRDVDGKENNLSFLSTDDKENGSSQKEEKCNASSVSTPKISHYTTLDLLRHSYTLVPLSILTYVWITHNVTYYGIFMTSTSLSGNNYLNFAIMALVEVPSNLSILYLFSRVGRLVVLRIFILMAAVSILASSLTIYFAPDTSVVNSFSTVLFIVGKFAISASLNAVFSYTNEVFPTVVRASSFSVCVSGSRVGSLVAPFFRLLYNLYPWAPGAIFSSMCLIAFAMISLLPETRDKILPTTMEEMKEWRKRLKEEKERTHSEEIDTTSDFYKPSHGC